MTKKGVEEGMGRESLVKLSLTDEEFHLLMCNGQQSHVVIFL
jgi:hypothetical protein